MIKRAAVSLLLLLAIPVLAQDKKPATLREVLLAELRSTHTSEEWFVSANIAVKGLTAEQASWTDGKGNHLPTAVFRRRHSELMTAMLPTLESV